MNRVDACKFIGAALGIPILCFNNLFLIFCTCDVFPLGEILRSCRYHTSKDGRQAAEGNALNIMESFAELKR